LAAPSTSFALAELFVSPVLPGEPGGAAEGQLDVGPHTFLERGEIAVREGHHHPREQALSALPAIEPHVDAHAWGIEQMRSSA